MKLVHTLLNPVSELATKIVNTLNQCNNTSATSEFITTVPRHINITITIPDNSSSKDGQFYQINASETGLYKFYCSDGKLCMGRIYEGDVNLLGIDDKAIVSTNIKAVNDRVYISNVKSSTEVSIYSITGALVKSFKTNENTNFSLKSGLWIATVKTEEGQKSVKLLTR
mgnify:CR=1 FL=1